MRSKLAVFFAVLLHAVLFYVCRNAGLWYGLNVLRNPFYTFAPFFIVLWCAVQFIRRAQVDSVRHPVTTLALAVVCWSLWAYTTNAYFACVGFMLTSLCALQWTTPTVWKHADGIYSAAFFTLPVPYHTEILSYLQIFALRSALSVSEFLGHSLQHEGSLVFLKDGPVRIAAACSGFQSLVVLFALAGMASYFLRLKPAGKFLLLVFAIVVAIGFNIVRVSSMFWVGNTWGVATAVTFWHGLSAWLFYLLSLGTLAMGAMGMRAR